MVENHWSKMIFFTYKMICSVDVASYFRRVACSVACYNFLGIACSVACYNFSRVTSSVAYYIFQVACPSLHMCYLTLVWSIVWTAHGLSHLGHRIIGTDVMKTDVYVSSGLYQYNGSYRGLKSASTMGVDGIAKSRFLLLWSKKGMKSRPQQQWTLWCDALW